MARHKLTQQWVADTIGISQPSLSYLLGNTSRDRARELNGSEAAAIELRVRAEKDPSVVLGEIWRDAGLVEDVAHPADVVAAYPFIDPDTRSDIVALIERAEARYLRDAELGPDEVPPARLVRAPAAEPSPRSRPAASADAAKRPRRRRA